MHFVLLSFAFGAAIQAAPLSRSRDLDAASLNPETNILLGRSGYFVGSRGVGDVAEEARSLPAFEDVNHALARDDEEDCDMNATSGEEIQVSDPRASSISESTAFAESSEPEDPELLEILTQVEDILDSDASAKEQIQWMLDAILHHSESLRESHEDVWPAEEIVRLVNDVVTNELSSDEEKVQRIFDEILEHTKHKAKMETALHEPVLYRIRAILYGSESSQKKIKKILNEIADHMNSALETTGARVASQVSLGDGADIFNGDDTHIPSEAERDAERILQRIALEDSKESGWS